MSGVARILCLGDVVGRPGRHAVRDFLAARKNDLRWDLAIVNGENSAGGLGLDLGCAQELRAAGADVITLGDHTWGKKEIKDVLADPDLRVIRPANYPGPAPGSGCIVVDLPGGGCKVGVCNIIGRVFFNMALECPFRTADQLIAGPLKECAVKIFDVHAEATSEKIAMGRYLDGRASLVFGTHTHVETADECVLPGGTGYVTDLGMSGSGNGVIGMDAEVALARFLTGMPHGYQVAEGNARVRGILCEIEKGTGRAVSIQRVA